MQIVELEQFEEIIANCRKLRIEEVDILVAIAKGKRKSDELHRKAA
jgi:hypothetical protein